MDTQAVSLIPLGGVGDVTKNMYLYEYQDQILIVDCGLGFADETMLGVDLLLPDISYLLSTKKKIIGMVLTHGHEDHIGALPFILPRLPQFPVYGTPLTAALANAKLKEFGIGRKVHTVTFDQDKIHLGSFLISFIRITHSVPDSANLFIQTPIGNFYHGSDFKFDLTPVDNQKNDFQKIISCAQEGVLCLLSDCLGSEREGYTLSEALISEHFEKEMRECQGKCIVTTYSSNISRLNQAIQVAESLNRQVCFVGRSLIKAKEVAESLGLMKLKKGFEIDPSQVRNYPAHKVLLLVAGSQGQENSAMVRIANGEHRDIKLTSKDVVVFSADPIPGNEVLVNNLVDTIAKNGTRVLYSAITDKFHVSGHGSSLDLMLMMSLVNAKKVLPIGGTFRQMVAYRNLAQKQGYKEHDILLIDDGQEIIFTKDAVHSGRKIAVRNVYVDEITGEEVESFVLRDRQKLSTEGIVSLMIEIDSSNGTIAGKPDIVVRGFAQKDVAAINKALTDELSHAFSQRKGRVTNWGYIRKHISDLAEQRVFKTLHKRPLILPVVIEV